MIYIRKSKQGLRKIGVTYLDKIIQEGKSICTEALRRRENFQAEREEYVQGRKGLELKEAECMQNV